MLGVLGGSLDLALSFAALIVQSGTPRLANAGSGDIFSTLRFRCLSRENRGDGLLYSPWSIFGMIA